MMKLQFLGATRQVTGSCYLLHAGKLRVLIDCGLFQERRFLSRNWADHAIDPATVDVVLLTHAHLDHCGLLPRFVRDGFAGRIITTKPSVDLAAIVMRDSARIHEEDAAYKRKRHEREKRKGPHPEVPLYNSDDAEQTVPLLHGVDYNEPVKLNDHLTVKFHDAGHILGSAMLSIDLKHDGVTRRLIFSGDIGRWDRPLLHDPTLFEQADYVVMESTYGDRSHKDEGDVEEQLARIINKTVDEGGKLLIPTFAIERAQELMYHIGRITRAGKIPRLPVILDSPMAVNVTDVFSDHKSYLDDDTQAILDNGQDPLMFRNLKLVRSVEESKAINSIKGPVIIMAGSGMCTGGRIKHHLVNNIENASTTVLFVGYQSPDTLGGILLSGVREVRIFGQTRNVQARMERIFGLSAHADRHDLLHWLKSFKAQPKHLFLTHGEETVAVKLANELRQTWNWKVTAPEYREEFELV